MPYLAHFNVNSIRLQLNFRPGGFKVESQFVYFPKKLNLSSMYQAIWIVDFNNGKPRWLKHRMIDIQDSKTFLTEKDQLRLKFFALQSQLYVSERNDVP